MPLPFIAAAAIVALIVSAGVATAVALWPSAKGKSVLLMGPKGSGKTTLRSFLTTGTVPKEYFAAAGVQLYAPDKDINLEDLKLKIGDVWDPADDRDAIGAWHKKAKDVDVLIYLVSLAEASDAAYETRVRRDTGQLHDWRRRGELKEGSQTILVVTHLDHDERFRRGAGSDLAAEAARIAREAPAVRAAVRELGPKCGVVAGSLVDEAGCADLTVRLLTTLQEAGA